MSNSERPEPIVRADAMAHALFERRDVNEMSRFLKDFGLVEYPEGGDTRYFRGHGSAPWMVSVKVGDEDRFLGFGVVLRERADLETLAVATGSAIEPLEAPGGGEVVRLVDPDGLQVNAIFGAAPADPLPTRLSSLPVNTPWARLRKAMLGRGQSASSSATISGKFDRKEPGRLHSAPVHHCNV